MVVMTMQFKYHQKYFVMDTVKIKQIHVNV